MTVRRLLLDLVSQEPRTVSSIARELGTTRHDVEEDLRHLLRSARAAGHRVEVVPARCKTCDFVFTDEKLSKPGKCPVCKGSRLFEPMIRIVTSSVLALLLTACAPVAAPLPEASSPPAQQGATRAAVSPVAQQLVDLTNAERKRTQLAPLAAQPQLMRAAQIHAEQMARAGRMDHVLPQARYPRLQDRLAAVDYAWQAIAENVAFGDRQPAGTVTGWRNSPPHRANMLNATYTELGTGYAVDAQGRPYYVQVFARPRR